MMSISATVLLLLIECTTAWMPSPCYGSTHHGLCGSHSPRAAEACNPLARRERSDLARADRSNILLMSDDVVIETRVVCAPRPDGMIGRMRYRLWCTKRSLLIWKVAVQQLVRIGLLRRGGHKGADLVERRRVVASKLRDSLIRLGPTFIKVGQLLSTRVDVLPREVIAELARLQNRVPGFPATRAKAIIEEEFGQPIDSLFASFVDEPIAAASLAQVHVATLHDGTKVCVKVQRDSLLDLFAVDLFNIRMVAALADWLDPQTEATAANWKGVADTSGEVLYREVDFTYERESAERFAANFASVEGVKVPQMYAERCSRRVLTMEYCPGVKIDDFDALRAHGFDLQHISHKLTTSYLEQVRAGCTRGRPLLRPPAAPTGHARSLLRACSEWTIASRAPGLPSRLLPLRSAPWQSGSR